MHKSQRPARLSQRVKIVVLMVLWAICLRRGAPARNIALNRHLRRSEQTGLVVS
jgi:hypothetical protein